MLPDDFDEEEEKALLAADAEIKRQTALQVADAQAKNAAGGTGNPPPGKQQDTAAGEMQGGAMQQMAA